MEKCAVCGNPALYHCPCNMPQTAYCSPDCQRKAWIAGHKYVCLAFQTFDIYGIYFNVRERKIIPYSETRTAAFNWRDSYTFNQSLASETRFYVTMVTNLKSSGPLGPLEVADPALLSTILFGLGLHNDDYGPLRALLLSGEGLVHRPRRVVLEPPDFPAVMNYLHMMIDGDLSKAMMFVTLNKNVFFQTF